MVSEDTDFGTLLALRNQQRPSVILFRRMPDRSSGALFSVLNANLPQLATHLDAGAIVVVEADRIRIRRLPIAMTGDVDR